MYKLTLFFGLLLYIGTTSAQIKSGEIVYQVEAPQEFNDFIDSTITKGNPESVKTFIKQLYNEIKQTAPYVRFNLVFNQEASLFEAEKNMDVDNGMNIDRVIGISGGRGLFYINSQRGVSIQQKKEYGKTWRMERPTDSLNWNIKDEYKTIQGYRCQKATAEYPIDLGRTIDLIAWFTPELPFHFGPNGIAGLPGAILGLSYNDYYIYATHIQLSKSEKSIKEPTKGELISFKEYDKVILRNDSRAREQYEKTKEKENP